MKRNTQPSAWKRAAVCGAVVWGVSLGSIAGASVLLTDNYNTPNGVLGDINANLGTRQGGTAAPAQISYTGGYGGAPYINNNRLLLEAAQNWPWNGTIASYDHSFTDAAIGTRGGMHMQLDLNVYATHNVADGNIWFGLSIGHTSTSRLPNLSPSYTDPQADFGINLTSAGQVNEYFGGVAGPSIPNFTTVAGQIHHVDLWLNTTSFNAGAPASVEVSLDGVALDLNAGAAGTAAAFLWDGGLANYISFESRTFLDSFGVGTVGGSAIDNLEISSIPEPAMLSLVALGGAFVAWRRKVSAKRA